MLAGYYGSFHDVDRIEIRSLWEGTAGCFYYAVTLPDEEELPVDGRLLWPDKRELFARIILALGVYHWADA